MFRLILFSLLFFPVVVLGGSFNVPSTASGQFSLNSATFTTVDNFSDGNYSADPAWTWYSLFNDGTNECTVASSKVKCAGNKMYHAHYRTHVLYTTDASLVGYGTYEMSVQFDTGGSAGADIMIFIGTEPYTVGQSDTWPIWLDYDVTHDMGMRHEAGPVQYCDDFSLNTSLADGKEHTIRVTVLKDDVWFEIDRSGEVCKWSDIQGTDPFPYEPTMLGIGFYNYDPVGTPYNYFWNVRQTE